MLAHSLCQPSAIGLFAGSAFCGGGNNGFDGALLFLGEFLQSFSLFKQQFKIFAFYSHQDSASLHISFALGMGIGRPVQRRTDTRGIPETLVAQIVYLLWRR